MSAGTPVPGIASSERARAAAAGVRHHYDAGNEFYRLWLDDSLTYSCAWRRHPDDTLATAQENKLRHHLEAVGADRAEAVLDIGCGWGSILDRLATRHGVDRAVGLTLSDRQAEYVRARRLPGVEVRLENWLDHRPDTAYDGIVSIGAFEHFARPDDSPEQKIAVYREFFTRCREWLRPGAALSLQTIVYADMDRDSASGFMQREIFPDADLPTLAEIGAAAEGVLEMRSLSNGRADYAWTCAEWARRLRARRVEAVASVGADTVARYERYLMMSSLGFRMGKIGLLRMVLAPYGSGWSGGGRAPR